LLSIAFGGVTLVVAPLIAILVHHSGVALSFVVLGVGSASLAGLAALCLRPAPAGYQPPGWEPSASLLAGRTSRDYTLSEALRTRNFYCLWLAITILQTPGHAMLSQAAAMALETTGVGPLVAASLIALMSAGSKGLLLSYTAVASLLGPLVIASVREVTGTYGDALYALAGVLAISLCLPFWLRAPGGRLEGHRTA
jgi:OFA family oxalate/formate antiporter-like MFS transporter